MILALITLPLAASAQDNGFAIEDCQGYEETCEPQIFFVVEDMPEFPGGTDSLNRYIAENLQVPVVDGFFDGGKVFVRFVIDSQGNVANPEILRGLGDPFDAEALRVAGSLPRFKPGYQSGKAVSVYFLTPIVFPANRR